MLMKVMHVGGPNDGDTVEVEVGSDGLPPELHTEDVMTAQDWTVDPATQLYSDISTQFYERDVRLDDDGIRHVYVWKGEQLHGLAA